MWLVLSVFACHPHEDFVRLKTALPVFLTIMMAPIKMASLHSMAVYTTTQLEDVVLEKSIQRGVLYSQGP